MNTSSTGAGAGAPTLSTLSPLLTAIVAALAAWKLFEPKFARIRAIKTEMGSLEPSLWWLYVLPQVALSLILWAIAIFLFLSFLFSFQGEWFAAAGIVHRFMRPDNVIWVIFLSGVVAAVIYWNVATRILLWITQSLSVLPVPRLRGRFGPNGVSPGWHQAASLCEGPDKGAPLLIDDQELERVGSLVLARLAGPTDPRNFADIPSGLSEPVKANIALFGCILEAEHGANRWPSPEWSQFYDAVAAVQAKTDMFSPQTLIAFADGAAFFEQLRRELDVALGKRYQPRPPNLALAAEPAIARAWHRLRQHANGNVLDLAPPISKLLGGRLLWLDRRLRKFPRLARDGMRTQLLKLLIRWDTLPGITRKTFGQPLARKLAWLLLEERALRALPEVKEITFNGTGEVAIARIAARRVIRNVAALIRAGGTAESEAVRKKLGEELYTLEEEADFVFWDWAGNRAAEARADNWNKDKWRWKFENGRVSRLG